MKRAFLTARGNVEIFGKLMARDDISELENHMAISNNYYAAELENSSFLLELIKKTGVFAVNFAMPEKPWDTKISGKYFDKFEKLGIRKKEAEKINCPLIEDSDAFECELNRIIEMGEKTVVIGNILKKQKV